MKKVWSLLCWVLYAVAVFFFFGFSTDVYLQLVFNGWYTVVFALAIFIPIIALLITKQFKKVLMSVLIIILVFVVVFIPWSVIETGYVGSDKDFSYYKNENGTVRAEIVKFDEYSDIVVREEYNGKTVTEIEWSLPYESEVIKINSLTIPSTIKKIDPSDRAATIDSLYYEGMLAEWCSIELSGSILSNVDKLYIDGVLIEGDLVIPAEVNKINNYTFAGYARIKNISFEDNSQLATIGKNAFYNCKNLQSVSLPEQLTSIDQDAFDGCNRLFSITLPKSLMYLDNSALPNSIIEIYNLSGVEIDKYCTIHTYSSAPSIIKNIDDFLFVCYEDELPDLIGYVGEETSISLPSIMINGNSNYEIADSAFKGSEDIVNVVIPDSVTSIGYQAFSDCTGLINVVIADSVAFIVDRAFDGCSSLVSVDIPDRVTSIGNYVFSGCDSLVSIVIPDGVTSIGDYVFSHCSSLESIVIPNSVTSIGNSAFSGCSSLTSVVIGDGVTSIDCSFYGCNAVKNIEIDKNNPKYYSESNCIIEKDTYTVIKGFGNTMPNYIKHIEYRAFAGCNFESIVIPDSVISIGQSAFSDCTSLSNVIFSESSELKAIGAWAFSECEKIKDVILPNSIEQLGYRAFDYNNVATKYKGVEYIGTRYNSYKVVVGVNYSFPDVLLGGIRNITLHKDAEVIADHALAYAISARSLTIPENVYLISEEAFSEYKDSRINQLSKITVDSDNKKYYSDGNCLIEKETATLILGCKNSIIPDGVTSIGNYAFHDCSNLTRVTIPDSVTYIGSYAFLNCNNLTSITIPDSVTSIGDRAFYNTAYYNNEGNWINNVLYINNHQIEAKDNVSGKYVIKDGTLTVADLAFYNCDNLTSVVIPGSVTSIGDSAFGRCFDLADVYYTGTEEEWKAISIGSENSDLTDATIYYNYVPEE